MRKSGTLVIQNRRGSILRCVLVVVAACFLPGSLAFGQWMGKQTGCYADSMAANPNRPTVANPADISQYGVLELEYGWDQPVENDGSQAKNLGGLLKFGLLCDVELRWVTTSYQALTQDRVTSRGIGDNSLGPQIRFYRQTNRVPSMAFSYSVKMPSADAHNGLGSGRVDHSFTFLASKDMAHFHFDFNFNQFLIGRQNASGFDQNQELDLAFSHYIYRKLQVTGEFYGDNRLNKTTPEFAATLWALTYTITPRLVIDGGFEVGLTSWGPNLHAFAGATYSIANLYSGWRRRESASPANHSTQAQKPQ